jgi:hypothetical protein
MAAVAVAVHIKEPVRLEATEAVVAGLAQVLALTAVVEQLTRAVVVAVAPVLLVVLLVAEALELLLSVTLVLNVARVAQSHHQAATPFIHLLLLGHTQHEQHYT